MNKDIGGIAIKRCSIEVRLIIAKICNEQNIDMLNSISEPSIEQIKYHPHVQFHSNLVDSFRGKHPKFVSHMEFIETLKNHIKTNP